MVQMRCQSARLCVKLSPFGAVAQGISVTSVHAPGGVQQGSFSQCTKGGGGPEDAVAPKQSRPWPWNSGSEVRSQKKLGVFITNSFIHTHSHAHAYELAEYELTTRRFLDK